MLPHLDTGDPEHAGRIPRPTRSAGTKKRGRLDLPEPWNRRCCRHTGCMTERTSSNHGRRKQEEQVASPVASEVAAVVARARAAAQAIESYTQEQVDELVTAVAWAVVRKDHAEALARLAVDEGGFGNYADKVAKISKRVTGVLADMTGLRTVGVVEELPSAGLVKIAKPVGVVAALIPTTGPDATRRSRRCSRSRAATRSSAPRTRGPPAPPRPWSGSCGPRASRWARRPTWSSRCRAVAGQDAGADAPGRPDRRDRRRGHGARRLQLGHPGLRGRGGQRGARGGRDRRPGRRGLGHPHREDLRLRHQLPGRQRAGRPRGRVRRAAPAAGRGRCAPV